MKQNEGFLNKIPRYIKDNPTSMAQLSKLTASSQPYEKSMLLGNTQQIASSIRDRVAHNDDILQIFPDIELPIQILVSSIISPNDMITVNINYSAPSNLRLPQDLKSTLTETIKDYIKTTYNLEAKLYDMLKEALFTKGAYVEAVIPEASLDDVINQFGNTSFESAAQYYNTDRSKNHVFLSTEDDRVKINNNEFSTEEFLGITVTENPTVLKLEGLKSHSIHKRVNKRYKSYFNSSLSLEEDNFLDSLLRPANTYKDQDATIINTPDFSSRKDITKPLVINLPVESVIPVHVKNNPKLHLGYFVVLDESGIPITKEYMDTNMYGNTSDALSFNQEGGSGISDAKISLITKARQELYGQTKKDPQLANPEIAYNKVLEKYLKAKIKDGEIGDIATFSDATNLYSIMLSRALANQKTKLLYLPSELVTYFAYDYRNNGTGKSLLEKCGILYSVRAILFFTKVMAQIRNSITNTDVNVNLGENVPNPYAVMETIESEVLKTRETLFPVGIGRVDDIVNFLHKTGYKFNFKHPSLPEVDIEQNDTTRSMTIPDMEFDNTVNEMILMSFGLTAEIVQSGIETDFATTVAAKNMLFAKRINTLQDITNEQLRQHIVRLLSYDPIIRKKLEDVVEANFKDTKQFIAKAKKDKQVLEEYGKLSDAKIKEHIINTFLSELDIFLPKIEVTQANGLKDAFEDYKTVLSDAVDLMFDTSVLSDELVGPLSGKLDGIKSIIKMVSLDKWLANNNYLPEISQFLTKDDEGKPVFNILAEFMSKYENLFDALLPFLKENKKLKEKQQKALDKAEADSSYSSSDSSSDTEENTEENNNENEENTDNENSENNEEGGEGEGGGEGGGDFDFDEDGGFGGFGEADEGKSKSKGKEETDADRKLKEAKAEKEYYYAQAAKLRAEKLAQDTGGQVEKYDPKADEEAKGKEKKEENPFGEDLDLEGGEGGEEPKEGNEPGGNQTEEGKEENQKENPEKEEK